MGKEPSLLDQFRSTKTKPTRCVVCFTVSPEIREVVEDGLKRGLGSVAITKWLRERGLWQWSNVPVESHRKHLS